MKRALVTGATGLAGTHLTEILLENNVEVIALGRDQDQLDLLSSMGATSISFDLTRPYQHYEVLNTYGDATWFHVASAISGALDDVLDRVNVEGTRKLVRKAEELQVPRFVQVSSISVYGARHDHTITEDSEYHPGSYYGETKLVQERIVKDSSLSWSIVRPPYIGGPYDVNFLEEFASRIEKNKMPTFSKDGIISYVDARDLAHAMIRVATSEVAQHEIYNVKSATIRHSELVNLIGEKLGGEPPFGPHYPYAVAMAIGLLGEVWAKLRGKASERGISRYRVRTLCREFKLDSSKLENHVGYRPNYPVEQSVEDWIPTRET